jgi:hypothetical protein
MSGGGVHLGSRPPSPLPYASLWLEIPSIDYVNFSVSGLWRACNSTLSRAGLPTPQSSISGSRHPHCRRLETQPSFIFRQNHHLGRILGYVYQFFNWFFKLGHLDRRPGLASRSVKAGQLLGPPLGISQRSLSRPSISSNVLSDISARRPPIKRWVL